VKPRSGLLVARGAIPRRKAADAAHLAVATVHRIQFLLTWNCTHLANAETWAQVHVVCAQLGYAAPIVCTSEALLEGKMTLSVGPKESGQRPMHLVKT
jgi:hypothetical protein